MSIDFTKKTSKQKIYTLFTSAILLASLSASPSVASVTDGVNAYNLGDYEGARIEWLKYAELGDAHALFNLGQLYRMGRGVNIDYTKAETYYLEAAQKGHIGAQSNLGTLHYFSKVPNASIEQAVHWWQSAAEHGDEKSQYMIGILHHNGEYLEKNSIKAYAWLFLSAKKKYADAVQATQIMAQDLSAEDIQKAEAISGTLLAKIDPHPDNSSAEKTETSLATVSPKTLPSSAVKNQAKKASPKITTDPATSTDSIVNTAESETADNFRIQIAAYHSEKIVYQSYKTLAKKYPDILTGFRVKSQTVERGDRSSLYRMQIVPFETRADANAVCTKLKNSGLGCFVVKTK
jgi:cell division septation protein DedD